jgi:transcriptional regulator with XRE-family HTH domain
MSFDPIDVHVGQRVKIKRKNLKMTQQELAKTLGLTFQQVQKYERGANRISASKLFLISETLNAPISYFFDGLEVSEENTRSMAEDSADFDAKKTQDVLSFASSLEGIELNRAFSAIKDNHTRKQLVALFDAVANAPSDGK